MVLAVADLGEGPGGPAPPPLFLDQTEAQRAEKACTKKRDARAKLSFYQSKPIASLTFSLPSPSPLLKLRNQSHDYRPLLIRLSCATSIRLDFTSDRSV